MLIKLNDRGIRVYMSSHYGARRDWQSRTGKVEKYSRNRSLAYVVWDGTRYHDRISVDLIEPTSSEGNNYSRPS